MRPIPESAFDPYRLLFFARQVLALVDEGAVASVEEVQSAYAERRLWPFLDQWPDFGVDFHDRVITEQITDLFAVLADNDVRRAHAIEHNGLLLLAAFATTGAERRIADS